MRMTKWLKADFHIHTKYSMDCDTPLEGIISRCRETGINCIAIADHDTIDGALKMQSLAPFPVIVAEEILTPHGEIMGMFLKERIPSGLSIEQVIARIRAQEGLVNLPHPFDTFRGLKLDNHKLEELAEQVDIIEAFNARAPLPWDSAKVKAFAQKYNLLEIAGSDAHTLREIGRTYIEIPEFKGRDELLQVLRNGQIHRQQASLLVHLNSTWARVKKTFQVPE